MMDEGGRFPQGHRPFSFMTKIRNVCVFCGSNSGNDPRYKEAARELAHKLVASNIGFVYGGASVGIMGLLADEVLAKGGRAVGVIPQKLIDKEVAHAGLTELHRVGSMHERKKLMFELSDAFLTFPGGFGTLDETFEIITWKQIELHTKPAIFLDINGFYRPLIEFIDRAVSAGFIRPEHRRLFLTASTIDEALVYLGAAR